MSVFKSGQQYYGTHHWWDSWDNEFEFCVTWEFEQNYPDMPDYWHLIDVELENYKSSTSESLLQDVEQMSRNGGSIWCDIEREGPSMAELQEVSYE